MRHWYQREGYTINFAKGRSEWHNRWWINHVFPYQPGRWTVWKGEGDYDIAFITKQRWLGDSAVFLGNLWHPLGSLVEWLHDRDQNFR